MGRVNTPFLNEAAKPALEHGHKTGLSHCYRTRCQVILLKATGRGSSEVGAITGMSYVSVNAWVKRYKDGGVAGLTTTPGRGRKPLPSPALDKQTVKQSVQAHRQCIQQAKAEWEQQAGKVVFLSVFKSFLKVLTADING